MLVGTDVCFCVIFVLEKSGVPVGNPLARPGDQNDHICIPIQSVSSYFLSIKSHRRSLK